ncbi:CAP domain-containing protein [Ilyonectria sp. MPI-CAGE-AT-0026]|nr:CAP domain-containing protein [Ilyonectria sp. MPI-CAGE-AT-0026]
MRSPCLCLVLTLPGLGVAEVVTVTVPAAIPSNVPEWKQDKTFTSAILNSTNFYRSEHNATALTWNETLEDFAADYLDGNDCAFEHSGGPYGENLAIGYPNATASVEAWGNERDEYNFRRGKFSHATGHFTQLVWKDTTDVGCGRRLCGESGWYLVCEYWPRGNVIGAFKEEVQAQEGEGAVYKPRVGVMLLMVLGCVLFWV